MRRIKWQRANIGAGLTTLTFSPVLFTLLLAWIDGWMDEGMAGIFYRKATGSDLQTPSWLLAIACVISAEIDHCQKSFNVKSPSSVLL